MHKIVVFVPNFKCNVQYFLYLYWAQINETQSELSHTNSATFLLSKKLPKS
jgi:hypothetical protein